MNDIESVKIVKEVVWEYYDKQVTALQLFLSQCGLNTECVYGEKNIIIQKDMMEKNLVALLRNLGDNSEKISLTINDKNIANCR